MSTPLAGLVLDLGSQQGEGGGGCNRPGRPVPGLSSMLLYVVPILFKQHT